MDRTERRDLGRTRERRAGPPEGCGPHRRGFEGRSGRQQDRQLLGHARRDAIRVSPARPPPMNVEIRYGEPRDVALITQLIRELARYEKLEHEMAATEEKVAKALFGKRPYAETLIAEVNGEPAGFA